MKRGAFSLLALSVALGLILTNTGITQLTEQWQAFAQASSKIEPAENTGDPMATVRQLVIRADEATALPDALMITARRHA